ncbi:hypothetical protein [Bailinhaonella thermotolerans]|uniref:Uncharacterized protein n=1 Tax=Bailinhaonella thermotolerans TaxID=1070861 RepID=A0A3A4A573_9ACTN|nr:hypothetical protein [Bailinhaonella thermotolerans]RJL22090.1 hypothetical protein D5H75_36470 [Bailinhaonella thermotolerans]
MHDHAKAALAAAIAERLRKHGALRQSYSDAESRDLLRSAGRLAGRLLGVSVRTQDVGDQVHIYLTDPFRLPRPD